MTYKRRTTASHKEGSKQKYRKSGEEYDPEGASSSKNTEGNDSYY